MSLPPVSPCGDDVKREGNWGVAGGRGFVDLHSIIALCPFHMLGSGAQEAKEH